MTTNILALSTKANGDIAEYRVVVSLLELGHAVVMPVGDRLPYDVGVDLKGRLCRLQVRRAYPGKPGRWLANVERSQTNRKIYKRSKADPSSYDFLIVWLPGTDIYYVFPSQIAHGFSRLSLTENPADRAGYRRIDIAPYFKAWNLIKDVT